MVSATQIPALGYLWGIRAGITRWGRKAVKRGDGMIAVLLPTVPWLVKGRRPGASPRQDRLSDSGRGLVLSRFVSEKCGVPFSSRDHQ